MNSSTLTKGSDVFANLKNTFERKLKSSDWRKAAALDIAIRNVKFMKAHIGSPGQSLEEPFVNDYYAGFPDMAPSGNFLKAWFNGLSARDHQKWTDQTNILFGMRHATSSYIEDAMSVVIRAGALLSLLFYGEGNGGWNCGSLGDARYKTGLHGAENVRHALALELAHEAFLSLPEAKKSQTLPDVNLTAEQIFFVGHCMKLSKYDGHKHTERLASPRARCNEPAMNMIAFSSAFRCSNRIRMNPRMKCSMWA